MQVHGNKAGSNRIPKDWYNTKMDSFLKIRMGQSPSSKTYNDQNVGLPFFQGVSDFGDINPKTRVWCSDPKVIANSNQILFSVRAPVGEVNVTNFECCIGRGIATLDPINSDLKYCFYLLKHFKSKFVKASQGTTFEAINRDDISNAMVPFTTNINEQQKIASILSKVDELIQKTDQIIEQTQRLRKGLRQRLLTRGLGHTELQSVDWYYGKTLKIPSVWRVVKLKEIIRKLKRGPSLNTNAIGKGVIYLTSDFITDDGTLEFEKLKFLDPSLLEDISKYLLEPGDVLLNCVNSLEKVGKVALFEGYSRKVIIGFNNFALSFNSNVNPSFIKHFFLSKEIQNIFKSISKPAIHQVSFSSKDLLEIKIPLPNLKEQEKIAWVFSHMEIQIQKNLCYKSLLEHLREGLMQTLLTGKIRVKV